MPGGRRALLLIRCGYGAGRSKIENLEHLIDWPSVKLIRSHFPRAREGRPSDVGQQSDPRSDRPARAACGGVAADRRRHFFFAELLLADSGSGRRWSSGDRGERDDAAAAGGRAARFSHGVIDNRRH